MTEIIIDKSLIFYRKLFELICKFSIAFKKPRPINGKVFLYLGLTDKDDFFKHLNFDKFERHIEFLTTHNKPVHLDYVIF